MDLGEFMTTEEIYAQFDSEWVVLADPVIENYEVKGGILVAHGKQRDEVYDKAAEIPVPRHTAFLYTGELVYRPPGLTFEEWLTTCRE